METITVAEVLNLTWCGQMVEIVDDEQFPDLTLAEGDVYKVLCELEKGNKYVLRCSVKNMGVDDNRLRITIM